MKSQQEIVEWTMSLDKNVKRYNMIGREKKRRRGRTGNRGRGYRLLARRRASRVTVALVRSGRPVLEKMRGNGGSDCFDSVQRKLNVYFRPRGS
jgi:hypothetical protein